jgi:hypothetical protein
VHGRCAGQSKRLRKLWLSFVSSSGLLVILIGADNQHADRSPPATVTPITRPPAAMSPSTRTTYRVVFSTGTTYRVVFSTAYTLPAVYAAIVALCPEELHSRVIYGCRLNLAARLRRLTEAEHYQRP